MYMCLCMCMCVCVYVYVLQCDTGEEPGILCSTFSSIAHKQLWGDTSPPRLIKATQGLPKGERSPDPGDRGTSSVRTPQSLETGGTGGLPQ